jgi:hypothetical protein
MGESVSALLEPPQRQRSQSRNAIKAFRHRRRKISGVRCYIVPVPDAVIATLIERGLAADKALDDRVVAAELGELLRQWSERWHSEKKRNP